MKTAIRVLVIVGVVIGLVWSISVFFGSALFAGCEIAIAAFAEKEVAEEPTVQYLTAGVYALGAFFVSIAALVFGLVASREKSSKTTTIVNGLLLFCCGIGATALRSWVAGPLFIISGFLGFLAGLMIKPKQENAGG